MTRFFEGFTSQKSAIQGETKAGSLGNGINLVEGWELEFAVFGIQSALAGEDLVLPLRKTLCKPVNWTKICMPK